MARLTKIITRTLSVRLSLMVVFAIAMLLMAAVCIMLRYARLIIKEETIKEAEQTLETTVQHIDNILLGVEQAAGNIYFQTIYHLDDPDRMFFYCQKLLESNPNIAGCAIAFEPYYYQQRGKYFMAYVHRAANDSTITSDAPIIQSTIFGNKPYNEQSWYTTTLEKQRPIWIDPLKGQDTDDEAITSFCLPIYDRQGGKVGVMGVDVSLNLLSQIVLAAKPLPNSYCTLLGSDGSYIVHPDSNKLFHQTVFTQTHQGADPSVEEAGRAMVAGETGHKLFRMNGVSNYVFYKPFRQNAVQGRSMTNLGWSVGIVFPEDDITADYRNLLYYVLTIALAGLLLVLVFCLLITHRQLLPLRLLTKSAQRIADGHYDEPIPDSRQHDEIGRLQDNFQHMQQSLALHVHQLEQLKNSLQERTGVLQKAYGQAQEADRMKTAFLHNMTNQMTTPVNAISDNVRALCDGYRDMDQQQAARLVEDIQLQGKTITELLNNLLIASQSN